MKRLKAFTLLELLIVIGVLAILSTTVILVINPADLLARARDSKRVSDLSAVNSAINTLMVFYYNASLGSVNTVYVSLPSDQSNCSDLNLPSLPSGWSYHCVTQANLTKVDGNGWIPIDFTQMDTGSPISHLPVDPKNNVSTGNYYAYVTGSSWELNAIMESDKFKAKSLGDGGDSDNGFEVGSAGGLTLMPLTFPHNWVKVPGSGTYNTSDFWVMKYEAKYSKTGKGADDAGNCYYTSGYDTWNWGNTAPTDCPSSWSNTNVVSSPYGSPIAGVTHTEAKSICSSLGGHLMTNQEWMTIARNTEQVDSNWSSGAVGTGCLFRGNVGNDDTCGYNGDNPEKGYSRDTKAKFVLSNGQEIWDIAGNVWEHVMKDADDTLVQDTPTDGGAAGWRWIEHTSITGYGDFSYNEIRPSNSSWNATQGMGRVYTYNGASANRVLLRGGYWHDTADAGAFTRDLHWAAGTQSSGVGFRCVR